MRETDRMVITDSCADQARFAFWDDGHVLAWTGDDAVCIERADVLSLYHALGDHLMATAAAQGVPTCCSGEDGSDCCPTADAESSRDVLGEWSTVTRDAEAGVYGEREADYGHPREDMTRAAILWTGLLHHKMADGAHLEPEDVARCMIGVKLARDVHSPKRDNRVDMAGYALLLDRLETGQ